MASKFINIILISVFFIYSDVINSAQDFCKIAIEDLKQNKNDILAVITINTNQPSLYSNTLYESRDCQKYVKKFTVNEPDVGRGLNGFCLVLPSSEISPNLCAVKFKLCLSVNTCQLVTFKLNLQLGKYISASPNYIELNF